MQSRNLFQVIGITAADLITQAFVWFSSIEKLFAIGLIVLNALWILYKWRNDIMDRKKNH